MLQFRMPLDDLGSVFNVEADTSQEAIQVMTWIADTYRGTALDSRALPETAPVVSGKSIADRVLQLLHEADRPLMMADILSALGTGPNHGEKLLVYGAIGRSMRAGLVLRDGVGYIVPKNVKVSKPQKISIRDEITMFVRNSKRPVSRLEIMVSLGKDAIEHRHGMHENIRMTAKSGRILFTDAGYVIP